MEGLFGEPVKINIIDRGGPMSTLEVIALRILALEVANTSGGLESKAHVIVDIGGLGIGPNMAVIAFVHVVHEVGLRMRGWDTNYGEDKISITIIAMREEIHYRSGMNRFITIRGIKKMYDSVNTIINPDTNGEGVENGSRQIGTGVDVDGYVWLRSRSW